MGLFKKQQSCWRVLWVPKGHEWTCWKGRKLAAWHLMPFDKHLCKQGCNCQCDQEIFNPRNLILNICPSVSLMFNPIQFCINIFVASLLFVVYLLLFIFFPVVSYPHLFILLNHSVFASVYVLFDLFCLIIRYLIIQCYFLFWYWKFIPGILIPVTTTIRQVNKHHTTMRHLLS